MRATSRLRCLVLLAVATQASPGHAQAAGHVDFANRFVPPWADDYLSCADNFAHRNFRMIEWAPRPPADLADAADNLCASRLPPPADPAPNAADLGLVRVRVTMWVRGRIESWRAAPVTITTTRLVPPAPILASSANADGKPRLLSCPQPEYPPAAVRAMAQGRTVVELDVDDAGQVVMGSIAGSSGPSREHRLMDNAALASMRGCVFDAAPGAAVRHTRLTYTWALSVEPAPPGFDASAASR